MNINDIKNVCVVGAGNMGHQISLLCAIYGYKTTCTDVIPEALKKAGKFCRHLSARTRREREIDQRAG